MGLLSGLRAVLGLRAEADARRDADPEDLFGMSTAHMTMRADLGYDVVPAAALCFSGVDSMDFADAVDEVSAILDAGREETGTDFALVDDDHGYRWVVLEDEDPEDLVTGMHFAADTLVERGYGSRLLAAVFGFESANGPGASSGGESSNGTDTASTERAYWIYSFRRGSFYPFAPRDGRERDSSVEFRLESRLDGELAVEDDREYWYPLWPNESGRHPWE